MGVSVPRCSDTNGCPLILGLWCRGRAWPFLEKAARSRCSEVGGMCRETALARALRVEEISANGWELTGCGQDKMRAEGAPAGGLFRVVCVVNR